MITEEQIKRFDDKYGSWSFQDMEKDIRHMPDTDPDKAAFYELYINVFITAKTNGVLSYADKKDNVDDIMSAMACYLKEYQSPFIEAFQAFLKGQKKKCIEAVIQSITPSPEIAEPLNENDFTYSILGPFKNAFPGFYPAIRKALDSFPTDDLVKLLCDQMDAFYSSDGPDQMAEALYPILQKYPDSVVANTLLGYTHYLAKRWGSAIACFEKVEGKTNNAFFWDDEIYFFKAWSYGKLREHKNAIKAYEKVLEIFPQAQDALNNMGYEYYLLKQYKKATEIFEQCLAEDRDTKYAANNYVRVLLASGRYKDAKAFVASGKYKIFATIRRKVDEAEDVNRKAVSDPILIDEDETVSDDFTKARKSPGEQFSSEKILEDELTMRIESGIPVFGKNLKIFRRHGEYGRQYIIPVGRLDLLAEDENGDLYIIELKKDSGYDDPYDQTAAYIDWFEKNHRKKGQKIFGIICLNSPGESLVEKVRKDGRMRLFNYSISYDEVK